MNEYRMMGLYVLLICVFATTLKLTNTVSWSWWVIFSPIWLPLMLFFVLVLIAFMGHRFK
jgi:hypothetical protein